MNSVTADSISGPNTLLNRSGRWAKGAYREVGRGTELALGEEPAILRGDLRVPSLSALGSLDVGRAP